MFRYSPKIQHLGIKIPEPNFMAFKPIVAKNILLKKKINKKNKKGQPYGDAGRKFLGSPKSLRFLIWEP